MGNPGATSGQPRGNPGATPGQPWGNLGATSGQPFWDIYLGITYKLDTSVLPETPIGIIKKMQVQELDSLKNKIGIKLPMIER